QAEGGQGHDVLAGRAAGLVIRAGAAGAAGLGGGDGVRGLRAVGPDAPDAAEAGLIGDGRNSVVLATGAAVGRDVDGPAAMAVTDGGRSCYSGHGRRLR